MTRQALRTAYPFHKPQPVSRGYRPQPVSSTAGQIVAYILCYGVSGFAAMLVIATLARALFRAFV